MMSSWQHERRSTIRLQWHSTEGRWFCQVVSLTHAHVTCCSNVDRSDNLMTATLH